MDSDKLIFAVDIDGVLCDLVPGLRTAASAATGKPENHFPQPQQYRIDLAWGLSPEEHKAMWHHAVCEQELFATAEMMHSAAETLQGIYDSGEWMINIVTSRLHPGGKKGTQERCEQIMVQTAEFLFRNKIPHDGVCFLENKPLAAADIAVDDSPTKVASWLAAGVPVFLMGHSYNSLCETSRRVVRVENWKEIAAKLPWMREAAQAAREMGCSV